MSWWRRILVPLCAVAPVAAALIGGDQAGEAAAGICAALLVVDGTAHADAKKALADELARVKAALPRH